MNKRAKVTFGQHIRKARIKRKLHVTEVAEKIGVSYQAVYYWENGHAMPRADNLIWLCRTLKLPLAATQKMAGFGR